MSSRHTKITLAPEVLLWARERASLGHEELAGKVDVKPETVEGWEKSEKTSFPQIDRLADHTYTPSGFLFLSKPPDESLPMTDHRTGSNSPSPRQSPNLLDTVYQMQSRQSWMRCEVFCRGSEPFDLVGKCGLEAKPQNAVQVLRDSALIGDKDWITEYANLLQLDRGHLNLKSTPDGRTNPEYEQ